MPFHLGDIAAGLTILSYYFTGQHGPQVRFQPEFRLFLIFVGLALLCTPLGFYPLKGLEFLFNFGIKLGIYCWLVAKLITTQERIQGILRTIMFSGFAMATSAILRLGTEGRIGAAAGVYDPNDLALILVTTLPIAIMQALSITSLIWKIVFFGGATFNLVGIIATRSRGGFLGLIAVGIFMLFIKLPGISKKKFILILTVLASIFGTYLGTEYKERIQTIFEESSSDLSAGSGRIAVWRQCIEIAKDHPIIGVGPGAFGAAYGHYLENDKFEGELSREAVGGAWHTAHNSFLLVLTEMGVPGLLIFLAINIRSFRNSQRIKAISRGDNSAIILSTLAVCLQMALVGFLACSFFLSQSYNALIYLFLLLSGAMIRLTPAKMSTL